MGFRFYKRVSLGKGLNLNLSKTGVGVSAGVSGLRYSMHSSGRRTATAGLPGTGLYYRKDRGGSYSPRPSSGSSRQTPAAPPATAPALKAPLFAPKHEKAWVKGVQALRTGQEAASLPHFEEARKQSNGGVLSATFFVGFLLAKQEGREAEGTALLEEVLASDTPLPDGLMQKYGAEAYVPMKVTPALWAEVPFSTVGAALMLAELYQEAGDLEKAMGVLEAILMQRAEDSAVVVASLAELYTTTGNHDEAIDVTNGLKNEEDVTCQALVFRARAFFAKGLHDAALEALKQALRSTKRSDDLLLSARYERGLVYEAMGKKAQARKDFEKVYAQDSGYADVAERLGQRQSPSTS